MKKKTTLILLIAALFFSAGLTSNAQAWVTNADIIDGNALCEVKPIVENDTTLVPMRFIFENLGATVDYDGKTKKITAYNEDIKITLQLNSKYAYINNSQTTLAVTPKLVKDTTLVPLRFVSETLGAYVDWDSVTGDIHIEKGEYQSPGFVQILFNIAQPLEIKNLKIQSYSIFSPGDGGWTGIVISFTPVSGCTGYQVKSEYDDYPITFFGTNYTFTAEIQDEVTYSIRAFRGEYEENRVYGEWRSVKAPTHATNGSLSGSQWNKIQYKYTKIHSY